VNTVFVSQPVVAAPAQEQTAPQAQPQQTAPAVKKGQSLQQLATTLASSQTANATHECLATAVYFEARGESLDGQLAVAEVVLNRSRSGRYPSDVCAVVKQPAQFSFVQNRQFPKADRGSVAWKKAVAIAKVAQDKLATKLSNNVLWYHADYVAPSWGKRLSRQAKIGTHIFYS
jgi:spore germination cell wall hydrolase CwlJ-like protein